MNNKRDLSLRKCACADSKRAFLNNIKAVFSQKKFGHSKKKQYLCSNSSRHAS